MQPRLTVAARAILDRHRPFVVAVSGSVGKTSTKDAVSCVLQSWKQTGAGLENQNDELGVPLSIVGRRPSGRNPLGWLATLQHARRVLDRPEGSYPDCLVLELGGCHGGDVEDLMGLTAPEIGVLTAVEATHLETYGSLEAIEVEEGKVVTMLPASGVGILTHDNAGGRRALALASCRIVSYGFDDAADLRGRDAVSSIDWDRLAGSVTLEVQCENERRELTIAGAVGRHSCYAPLAALAVGRAVGIPFEQAIHALGGYAMPAGRMGCLAGVRGSMIVDDSYNSSPAAALLALDTLASLSPRTAAGERIAVLGPMTELGPGSRVAHEEVGRHAAALGIDRIVTVGEEARAIADGARRAGMPVARIVESSDPEDVSKRMGERLRPGDIVLVKGSQHARLDRLVRRLALKAS